MAADTFIDVAESPGSSFVVLQHTADLYDIIFYRNPSFAHEASSGFMGMIMHITSCVTGEQWVLAAWASAAYNPPLTILPDDPGHVGCMPAHLMLHAQPCCNIAPDACTAGPGVSTP